MKQTSEMGMNRTGMQVSPFAAGAMKSGSSRDPIVTDSSVIPKSHDASLEGIKAVRTEYIASADPMGTVPLPATLKGTFKAGMTAMKGADPTLLIDKLGERLAFERGGVRLYDSLIVKCQAQAPDTDLGTLFHFRAEEAKHFQIVWDAIEKLGADPTAQTPAADAAGVSNQGLMQILADPRTTIEQCVQAVHVAELVDNDAWDLLIKLARESGQEEMADSFQDALDSELEHLDHIRRWHEELVLIRNAARVQ